MRWGRPASSAKLTESRRGISSRSRSTGGAKRWLEQGHVPADLVQDLAQTSGLAPALRQHLPWLSDEIAGIAEGANASVDDVFALNCLDEAWWWGQPGPGCSVIGLGVTSGGSAICGQTMDLDPWMDGTQIALRLAPDDAPAQVLLSRAGMIGLCGANEAGVAVLVNTLSQLPVSPNGVFVAGAMRAAIASKSVDDAKAALTQLPHASGQAYTLVSEGLVRGLECGAGVVAEYVNDVARPERTLAYQPSACGTRHRRRGTRHQFTDPNGRARRASPGDRDYRRPEGDVDRW